MSTSCFNVTIEDKVAHIQLNRPEKLNSMIEEFWMELPNIVNEISSSAQARVIVISSTGKHFSAGMDLSVFSGDLVGEEGIENGRRGEAFRYLVKKLQDTFSCLANARMPVLVAVQGGCIGGAVDLTTACDIRYCTQEAFFCIQEINIGMTADVGTFPRLCHLIPDGMVRELAYTGRRLYAEKAKEIGLVNEVYETQEEMLAAVMETAKEIASKTPLGVAGSKVMINYAKDHSVADTLDYISVWQTGMFRSPDLVESFTAMGEKRAPDYEDLQPVKSKL